MYCLAIADTLRQASIHERKVRRLSIDDKFQFVVMAQMGKIH